MKGLKILIISIIFFPFLGCTTLKINPSEEKVGILDRDYKISYFKRKKEKQSVLKINTFDENNNILEDVFVKISKDLYTEIRENNVFYLNNEGKTKKYYTIVGAFGYKSVHIGNIKINQQDSIILNVYLKDYPILY